MKWLFVQGSMESRHCLVTVSPLSPPPYRPSFWKVWLRPRMIQTLKFNRLSNGSICDMCNEAKGSLVEGNSCGEDNIPPEILKRYNVDDISSKFCNLVLLYHGDKPSQWSILNIMPTHKSRDLSWNYRGIYSLSLIVHGKNIQTTDPYQNSTWNRSVLTLKN